MPSFHDFEVRSIDGDTVPLSDYAGKVCLVVNVASQCGLTPQYAGLQSLQQRLHDRGFDVLAFPCNQFGGQEPGSNAEICEFAQSKYGADFPMFEKVEVNGDGACDLYRFLKSEQADEDGSADVKWNFTKFLVDGSGAVVARFGPAATPEDIAPEIEARL